MVLYGAVKLAILHDFSLLLDGPALHRLSQQQLRALAVAAPFLSPLVYPPSFLVLLLPFSGLGLMASFFAFQLITAALLAAALMYRRVGRKPVAHWIALAVRGVLLRLGECLFGTMRISCCSPPCPRHAAASRSPLDRGGGVRHAVDQAAICPHGSRIAPGSAAMARGGRRHCIWVGPGGCERACFRAGSVAGLVHLVTARRHGIRIRLVHERPALGQQRLRLRGAATRPACCRLDTPTGCGRGPPPAPSTPPIACMAPRTGRLPSFWQRRSWPPPIGPDMTGSR